MADFVAATGKHRHLFSVTTLQFGNAVDIDDLELEMKTGLHLPQAGDHFLAQMAIVAAVYRQPDPHQRELPLIWKGT